MILELIKKRRAVFPAQYNGEPIEENDIKKILEAANWAPTHKRTEPWRFKVIRGGGLKRLGEFMSDKYSETETSPKDFKIKKLRENPQKSAAVILICMQRDPLERVPEWEELAATAMAVQNMWLSCTELEIGCYWSSPGLIEYMDEFTDFNEGEKCLGLLYMGRYDQEIPDVDRTPIEDKISWIS